MRQKLKLVCMCRETFSLVPYADDRENAEPTDEQQHQESGQGMQLHCEAAGRFGVHLHDSGQLGTNLFCFPYYLVVEDVLLTRNGVGIR